ncbi:MAG TPA: hypothetical protein DIW30_03950, partial [Bacteroidales bacterium]|nr:hypothetical protein [Bacteroidales bacterium]
NATANTLQVYPNPAVENICITGAADIITIYNLAGQIVLRVPAEEGKTIIDITALPAGLYMVRSVGSIAPVIVK